MIENQNESDKTIENGTKDTPLQEDKSSDSIESQSEEGASCKTEYVKETVVQNNKSNQELFDQISKVTSDNKINYVDSVCDLKSKLDVEVETKSKNTTQRFSQDFTGKDIYSIARLLSMCTYTFVSFAIPF